MQWILWRVCRLSADTAAKLSAVVGDEVGWLQQQIRVWLPAFWRQCWHSIQRYDSHATTHRRQVRSLIQLLQHATSDSVSLLYETYPGCSTPLINHKLMILYYLHRAQISVLWDNRGYTMRKWDVSKFSNSAAWVANSMSMSSLLSQSTCSLVLPEHSCIHANSVLQAHVSSVIIIILIIVIIVTIIIS